LPVTKQKKNPQPKFEANIQIHAVVKVLLDADTLEESLAQARKITSDDIINALECTTEYDVVEPKINFIGEL
jgi:hypothetical protein